MIILRGYQEDDVRELRARFAQRHRSVLYVAPTGSGKTTTVAHIIECARDLDRQILFLAHRRELIEQCSERLSDHNIPHGICMAGHRWSPEPVQVASIQTLVRRKLPPATLIVVDEAHHTASDSYSNLLEKYPQARVLGLTATPIRLDGRGLKKWYSSMVLSLSPRELTERGYLAPARVFAPFRPDTSKLRTKGGDWAPDQVQALMDRPKITGDIVEHWLRLGAFRPTIVFASGVKHSLRLVEKFTSVGVTAAHIDADTPRLIRKAILKAFHAGQIQVVSNCGILTEGWDCPRASCVILARPTKSLSLYLQMVGRVARIFEGKDDYLVLDHAGLTALFGFAAADREWALDARANRKKVTEDSPSVRMCSECYAAYEASLDRCPYCQHMEPVKERKVSQAQGELVEITDGKQAYTIRNLSKVPQIRKLQEVAAERGYKPGWVFLQMERLRRGLKVQIPAERRAQCRKQRSLKRHLLSATDSRASAFGAKTRGLRTVDQKWRGCCLDFRRVQSVMEFRALPTAPESPAGDVLKSSSRLPAENSGKSNSSISE